MNQKLEVAICDLKMKLIAKRNGSKGNDMSDELPLQVDRIGLMIQTIRGRKVILDSDLARVYGVPTKRLNEHVNLSSIGSTHAWAAVSSSGCKAWATRPEMLADMVVVHVLARSGKAVAGQVPNPGGAVGHEEDFVGPTVAAEIVTPAKRSTTCWASGAGILPTVSAAISRTAGDCLLSAGSPNCASAGKRHSRHRLQLPRARWIQMVPNRV